METTGNHRDIQSYAAIAKAFLRQIKREFEGNDFLRSLFPDVIWDKPQAEAPKWSEDDGIILKRTTNPKEGTVEAWGVVDGQPTSKHFHVLVFDPLHESLKSRSTTQLGQERVELVEKRVVDEAPINRDGYPLHCCLVEIGEDFYKNVVNSSYPQN